MSSGQGQIIARRSVSLSKTYTVVGIFLAGISALISGLSGQIGSLETASIPVNAAGTNVLDFATALPLVSVALQVFAAVTFATPVLLLYVYDKNNGVLEYFLSLGMTQGGIFRQYLKAALILASVLIAMEFVVDIVVGVAARMSGTLLLEVSGLVVVMAIPAVSLGTMIMMSFSSLQKQRVGTNQPLGMALGIFMVIPAYIIPLVLPSLAVAADLLLAGVIALFSLVTYLSSSRLISREKLLP